MSQDVKVEYPDLLGYITDVERFNVGAIQTALAVRPDVARAGRPFEVLLLIQNASDSPVDVTVVLTLPDRDVKKQKGCFIAKVNRLVIGVQPAEVGYVVLPVNTLPTTAPADYKLAIEVNVKMLEKGQRIRLPEQVPLPKRLLQSELIEKLDELKTLTFSSQKRTLLKNTLEVSIGLLPGKAGKIADLKPGWVSLWTMMDFQSDPFNLVTRFHKEMIEQVLPNLVRMRTYKPLYDATLKKFENAGYPLKPLEASFIARLMTLILEYAATSERIYDTALAAPPKEYQVKPTIDQLLVGGELSENPPPLPRWAVAMLRSIAQDKRAAQFPERAVVHFAYNELLSDAMKRGFYLIEAATGEDLGTDEDKEGYVRQVLDKLAGKSKMDFTYAYMPLIMGGIVIYDSVLMSGEKLQDIMTEMSELLYERRSEMNEDNQPVFMMAKELLEQGLMKFGLKVKI